MRIAISLVLLIMSAAQAQATRPATRPATTQGSKSEWQAYIEAAQAARVASAEARLKEASEVLSQTRSKPPKGKREREQAIADAAAKVDFATAALAKIKASAVTPKFDKDRLEVGQMGIVESVRFIQIVGDIDVIADIYFYGTVYDPRLTPGSIPRPRREAVTVWIRGVPTAGKADGMDYGLNRPMKITGTQKYEARSGQRTVVVLEPAD